MQLLIGADIVALTTKFVHSWQAAHDTTCLCGTCCQR